MSMRSFFRQSGIGQLVVDGTSLRDCWQAFTRLSAVRR